MMASGESRPAASVAVSAAWEAFLKVPLISSGEVSMDRGIVNAGVETGEVKGW